MVLVLTSRNRLQLVSTVAEPITLHLPPSLPSSSLPSLSPSPPPSPLPYPSLPLPLPLPSLSPPLPSLSPPLSFPLSPTLPFLSLSPSLPSPLPSLPPSPLPSLPLPFPPSLPSSPLHCLDDLVVGHLPPVRESRGWLPGRVMPLTQTWVLPDARRYGVSARTGWLGVSMG